MEIYYALMQEKKYFLFFNQIIKDERLIYKKQLNPNLYQCAFVNKVEVLYTPDLFNKSKRVTSNWIQYYNDFSELKEMIEKCLMEM